MDKQYWVVGAMWGGTEDVLKTFLLRGYWYCWDIKNIEEPVLKGTGGNSVQAQRKRFLEIRKDDRIAVKRMLGGGAKEIEIRALGIVEDVDHGEWRVYVRWITDENFSRKVPLKGCTASIHGPFEPNDPWVQQVFCL